MKVLATSLILIPFLRGSLAEKSADCADASCENEKVNSDSLVQQQWTMKPKVHLVSEPQSLAAANTAGKKTVCAKPLTPATAVKLGRDSKVVTWPGGLQTDPGTDYAEWYLKKCSGKDASTCLGRHSAWTDTTSDVVSGDTVAWVNKATNRVYDCAWGGCSKQPYPPPGGHWGTPYTIQKMQGGAVAPVGTQICMGDPVSFYGMQGGVYASNWIIGCTDHSCQGGRKQASDETFYINDANPQVAVRSGPGEVTVESFSDASCTTPVAAHGGVHKTVFRKVPGSTCFQMDYYKLGETGSATKGYKLDGTGDVETYVAADCSGTPTAKFAVAHLGLELLRCPSGCVAGFGGTYAKWSGEGFDPDTDNIPTCTPVSPTLAG